MDHYYYQGRRDYWNGVQFDASPYPFGSIENSLWERGWLDAGAEEHE